MRALRSLVCLTVAMVIAAGMSLASAEEEIMIGRSAGGQLKVQLDIAQPLPLEASVFPGISGYATGAVGIHSAVYDDPTNDFFQLSTAADFRFVLVAKDPGMEVWNDTGSGFMATNDMFFIGPAPFDTHPIWNIVNGTPGNAYSLTIKVRDVNGVYPESGPFVLSFTPVQVRYRLDLKPVDTQHATLLWATNAVGWQLQSATTVTAANWESVINVPGFTGTNFALSITTAGTAQFFRLRQP
ncbi:MAG: hypothetical protein EXS35_04465 [Pedosphaera sp.]|nr:hypothetical protein [Pedosphaera sp.]